MKTDIEIAQEAKMKPITQIAAQLGLEDESVIPYGRYKAKIDHRLIHNAKKQGKLRRRGRRSGLLHCARPGHTGWKDLPNAPAWPCL